MKREYVLSMLNILLCTTLYEGIISALRECNVEMSFRHAMGFVLLLLVSRELDLHARKDRANIYFPRAHVFIIRSYDRCGRLRAANAT